MFESMKLIINNFALLIDIFCRVKTCLHRRFLLRQLNAIFVALKLQQVSNMFETLAISR